MSVRVASEAFEEPVVRPGWEGHRLERVVVVSDRRTRWERRCFVRWSDRPCGRLGRDGDERRQGLWRGRGWSEYSSLSMMTMD